jgi:hypothetical protein
VPRKRLDGLRFVATDVDSSHGSGPELRGRAIDLSVAACGRGVVLDRLEGDGVGVLRSRLALS